MSQTLSGMFLVGAFILIGQQRGKGQIGKISRKIGKIPKNRESHKKDEKGQKGRTSPDQEAPCLKPPCLAARFVNNSNCNGLVDVILIPINSKINGM